MLFLKQFLTQVDSKMDSMMKDGGWWLDTHNHDEMED